MNFYDILDDVEEGRSYYPFSSKVDDEWIGGTISIDFLNNNFGQYSTAEKMIEATESEGLKLYFQWLKDQSILN